MHPCTPTWHSAKPALLSPSMAYILHQSPTGHGHGTAGYEQLESTGGSLPSHGPLPGSTSVRAAFIHVVGDLLQSIGVLVAATIIYFKVPGLEPPPSPGAGLPQPHVGCCGVGAGLWHPRTRCPARLRHPRPHTAPALCSPSARSQTPSAPSSSLSLSSAPPSPSSRTSSESSWKVCSGGGGCGTRGAGHWWGCRALVGAQELLGAVAATAPSPRGSSPPHNLCPPPSPPLCPSLAPLSPPSPSVLSHPGKGPVVGRRLTTEPPCPGHSPGKPPPPTAPTTSPGPGGGQG